jgi:hypothetical protein
VLGALACVLDAYTTWLGLRTIHVHERAPATRGLIAEMGLTAGLAMSVLLRIAVFSLIAVAAQRLPRIATLLIAIGLVAIAITWSAVFANIATLAAAGA